MQRKPDIAAAVIALVFIQSATAQTGHWSDCRSGSQDSSCILKIDGGGVPPTKQRQYNIYDGPLAGVPAAGNHYWGYDYYSHDGINQQVGRLMYVNHSDAIIRITLRFDIPNDPCGHNCLPGVEFKLGNWSSFFPNIVKFENKAEVSVEIEPNQTYGWVIGLWMSKNPNLIVSTEDPAVTSMAMAGLPENPSIVATQPGTEYDCDCPDGSIGQCWNATFYSTGYIGAWRNDTYFPEGQGSNCPDYGRD